MRKAREKKVLKCMDLTLIGEKYVAILFPEWEIRKWKKALPKGGARIVLRKVTFVLSQNCNIYSKILTNIPFRYILNSWSSVAE